MKAYLLFTFLLLTITGSAIAQNPAPIRETLFGTDYKEQMQQDQKSNERVAADPRKTATSTRSIIFSDYHPPTAKPAACIMNTTKQASGKALPSSISAKEAAAKAPKPAIITPPTLQQDVSSTPEAKSVKSAPATKKN